MSLDNGSLLTGRERQKLSMILKLHGRKKKSHFNQIIQRYQNTEASKLQNQRQQDFSTLKTLKANGGSWIRMVTCSFQTEAVAWSLVPI